MSFIYCSSHISPTYTLSSHFNGTGTPVSFSFLHHDLECLVFICMVCVCLCVCACEDKIDLGGGYFSFDFISLCSFESCILCLQEVG